MSYFDWNHLIKPFSVQPVVQDTTENVKPLSLTPVQAVGTVLEQITVPSITLTPYVTNAGVITVVPLIIAQLNYSVGTSFAFTNWQKFVPLFANQICTVCVRFRVGNTVTRYVLFQSPLTSKLFQGFGYQYPGVSGIPPVFAPLYTGQIIKPNFVLEFWQVITYNNAFLSLVTPSFSLTSGVIYIPQDEEDTGPILGPSGSAALADLETTLPENVPTAINSNGPWLTN